MTMHDTPTKKHLVLSALGPDRPGLVAEVTRYLTERGANIVDSRMAVLGAEFGIQVLVSAPNEAAIERVAAETEELERATALGVLVRRTKSPEEHRRAAVVSYAVTVDAIDHEGIVYAVALALSRMGINIVSLETSGYHAPITGSPLFRVEGVIDVPQGVSVSEVRRSMAEVARTENLDIEVRALTRG